MSVGQEQRCTICCSEYVKDEIITELPCHHLFHKTCITLWLQKVSTTGLVGVRGGGGVVESLHSSGKNSL